MRDKIVAGNWKMNNNQFQTKELLNSIKSFEIPNDVRVMVAPAFTQLSQSKEILSNTSITVVAQNINAAVSGAYTGEISADMLKGIEVTTTLIGHSERRAIFRETDSIIKEKVKAALDAEMGLLKNMGVNTIRVYTGIPSRWITYIYNNFGIYTASCTAISGSQPL